MPLDPNAAVISDKFFKVVFAPISPLSPPPFSSAYFSKKINVEKYGKYFLTSLALIRSLSIIDSISVFCSRKISSPTSRSLGYTFIRRSSPISDSKYSRTCSIEFIFDKKSLC